MSGAGLMMANAFHYLGPVELIPLGEGRLFQAGSAMVAIFRTRSGRLFATQADCPHKAGPLADGIVGEKTLICPLHANKFDLETGKPIGNDCASLKTYQVEVSAGGQIVLSSDVGVDSQLTGEQS